MTMKSIWLRRIHKWVGLVIGLQVLLFAVSGTGMALLDMAEVGGGPSAPAPQAALLSRAPSAWPRVQAALDGERINKLTLRQLATGAVYEVTTTSGVRLFRADDGGPVRIDAAAASSIARAAHPEGAAVTSVKLLEKRTLAVREHQLPIWQVDFRDGRNSSYYVSGATGALLERRNDAWRWWDFFWMLHNMDYGGRTSFNHPLIIMVGFAMAWLSATGFWLLFRTMWRHDFAALRRLNR